MHRCSRSFFAGLAALLALCLFIVPASAVFDVAYCSSQNTADNFSAKHWDWQSNGWCTDECKKEGKYAFAVILEKDCWCSDYIPEDQQDTGDCNSNCPGFPTEKCGNTDDNLYIYLKLDSEPSGTAGGSKPTSVKSPTPTPTTLQTTTSDELAPPQTSVRVITESGAIITQTVVTTPTAAPVQQTRKSSSNTGAIVGGVVGGLVGVIALVGSIFFILWRHRKQQKEAEDPQTGVQRNTSTMSKSGLLRTEKEPQFLPPIMTNFNGRQSRNLDQDSISPISGSDQRNSRHMVDQRLNPSTIFVFENNSTGSLGSVDDSRDYHRPLNVRNPDPEA